MEANKQESLADASDRYVYMPSGELSDTEIGLESPAREPHPIQLAVSPGSCLDCWRSRSRVDVVRCLQNLQQYEDVQVYQIGDVGIGLRLALLDIICANTLFNENK